MSRLVYAYLPLVLFSTLYAISQGIRGEIAVMATLNFDVLLEVVADLFNLAMCLLRTTDRISN
jgi:hypothetical protein